MHEIRLELARDHDFPDGSRRHGYVFRAPLDAASRIDQAEWRARRATCTVTRFWGDADEEHGRLAHGRHGWSFTYDGDSDEDEPLHRLGDHVMKQGEYVSILEPDGVQRTFRIVRVAKVAG